ncbi:MAG: hypothetical protein WBL53_06920, partial [Pseudonocardiaceae bacterium]
MTGGVAASGPTPPWPTAPHVVIQRHRRDSSAVYGPAGTTISAAARATSAVTGAVCLVTERIDIQGVHAEATPPEDLAAAALG